MHETRNDMAVDLREKVAQLLNESLADCIHLGLQAKQAHWNVKGPNFIALHELFDKVAAAAAGFTDEIAERITALGGTAEGTLAVVSQRTKLPEYPLEIARGADHVSALAGSLAALGKASREAIAKTAEWGDVGTSDLYTGISREIDKQLWFVEAHLQGEA